MIQVENSGSLCITYEQFDGKDQMRLSMSKAIKNLKNQWAQMSLPAKASLAFLICSFFQRGISTITTPIFTRLLTTEQYGYYNVFNSWLEVVSVFTTLKLGGGVFTQALVKYDKEREEFSAATAGLGTTISLVLYALYLPFRTIINEWIGMPTLIMTCIFAASWATLMFELWATRQRVDYRYKSLVALTVATTIAKPLTGIAAIIIVPFELKAQARIVSLVAVEIISYTWIFILFLRRGKTYYNKMYWKYSLSLNIPLIPHYLSRTILHQCDRIMIRSMVSYSSAGIYSLAYNLAMMLSLFTNALLHTFNPWMYQRIKAKEYHRIGKLSYAILTIVAILGIGLISLAPEIVRIFAPAAYYEAIWVIPPVTASVYFLFMYSLFANFEFYFEKPRFMAIASTSGGILNIVLNYFCIRAFGYIAAGYTTLACYMFFAIAHYFAMKKILKSHEDGIKVYNIGVIFGISAAFLAAAGIMMLTYNHFIIRYVIILLTLLIVFVKRKTIMGIIHEIRKK